LSTFRTATAGRVGWGGWFGLLALFVVDNRTDDRDGVRPEDHRVSTADLDGVWPLDQYRRVDLLFTNVPLWLMHFLGKNGGQRFEAPRAQLVNVCHQLAGSEDIGLRIELELRRDGHRFVR